MSDRTGTPSEGSPDFDPSTITGVLPSVLAAIAVFGIHTAVMFAVAYVREVIRGSWRRLPVCDEEEMREYFVFVFCLSAYVMFTAALVGVYVEPSPYRLRTFLCSINSGEHSGLFIAALALMTLICYHILCRVKEWWKMRS